MKYKEKYRWSFMGRAISGFHGGEYKDYSIMQYGAL
jgi:hypothetical protein